MFNEIRLKGHTRSLIVIVVFCICLLIFAQTADADTIIYGANAYGYTDMIEIDLTNGVSQKVGDTAFETQAMDQDPQTGYIYYFEWRTTGDEFAYWDPATSNNTTVRTYDPAPGIYAKQMAFSPEGTLYILDNQDRLYTIDKFTGDIIFKGQVTGLESGDYGRTGDFAFAPDGKLYLVTYQSLYELELDQLSATLLYSNLIEGEGDNLWTGLAYCDGLLYASNLDEITGLSSIFSIDPATGFVNQLLNTQAVLNDLSSCQPSALQNHPPVLDAIGARAVNEGELLEFAVSASDPDPGDTLTYSADNVPAGADFDPASGVFSWAPGFGDAGNYVVTFLVSDDGVPIRSDTEQITITVNASSTPIIVTLTGVNDTEDTMIANGSYSSRNYGGSTTNLAVGSYGNILRALIKWNLALIPAGSTIMRAEMSLYCRQDYTGGPITINAYRMLQSWVEGTLQDKDRMLDNPYSASWLEYGYGEQWEAPGASGAGDRDPSILALATKSGTGWYVWDLTATVQHWVDGDWSNNGLILVSNNEGGYNVKIFSPSEYQSENLRPKLVIEYKLP